MNMGCAATRGSGMLWALSAVATPAISPLPTKAQK